MAGHSLHSLIESLSPEAFSYLFPGFRGADDILHDEPSLYEDDGIRFRDEPEEIPIIPEECLENDSLDVELFGEIPAQEKPKAKKIRKGSPPFTLTWRKITRAVEKMYEDREDEERIEGCELDLHPAVDPAPIEEEPFEIEPDERTRAILSEIEALKARYGVTSAELEALLGRNVKMSRLRITARKEVILEDYGRKEVRIDDLSKAVFLLFLRHPEGIRYKDLQDHREELGHIYMSITGRSELEDIRRSIDALVNPYSNSINEKVSRIKRAFRDVVDDRVARLYYIDGARGEVKRIAIERADVMWD